jgi:phosphate transport system permease protein
MEDKGIRFRIIKDRMFFLFIVFFSLLCAAPLFLIFYYLVKNGLSSISLDFLLNLPKPVGEEGGGLANAIAGTLLLIVLASVISIPVGVTAGIYLSENKKSRTASYVRMFAEILQGVPSIVIGIFVYLWVVVPLGGFSAVSGAIALAVMMLPVIVRSTEETLNLLPYSLKEASMALGVPYYRTIIKVILPTGFSGILTGVLLSIARISGETAPLLFTAFGNPFWSLDITRPISCLPLEIYQYAMSPFPEWHKMAWGASFVLIVIVLLLNIFSKLGAKKWKVQY